jgi:beta-glucosidase
MQDQFTMPGSSEREEQIHKLLSIMSLEEKIGQLNLINSPGEHIPESLRQDLKNGRVGAILNEVNVDTINELQRIAAEESRLGIPLLIGRDVIHGFKTIFPIPLGQAASWNPGIIRESARVAAIEAASSGINWTFAPMIDIGRDPRWGRIAETLGEDPYLTGVLGTAMIEGFQGNNLASPGSIAACAKHFAGYGASESGRDYNTTNIPEIELRNTHLPPFKSAIDAGVASLMVSFSDINGVPASANEFLLKQILRTEWLFNGFVVSDWESIAQLQTHGLTSNDKESAFEAASAGLDMEMASHCYEKHLAKLISENRISIHQLNAMVANILRVKFQLGLFENPYTNRNDFPEPVNTEHAALAKKAAIQSSVLLKNTNNILPLNKENLKSIAVIGPLADDGYEQLGTWVFDGDAFYSRTPLQSIREFLENKVKVSFAKALPTTRSKSKELFAEAIENSKNVDAVILFLGEESILSGEAHCRAEIGLPGIQTELIRELASTGVKIILVIMAGRPLALENIINDVDAVLFTWHGGSMAGPAITDLLFGLASPSGKLPVTFPRVTGQIPMYYSQKNTGKPVTPETYIYIDNIAPRSGQVSVGNTSFHLDVHYSPLFPFGFGLSYTTFSFSNISTNASKITLEDTISISAEVTNTGGIEAEEVVQLYIRDVAASITRPLKELKGFQRIRLSPGEKRVVVFTLHANALAFYGRDMKLKTEPGLFHVWVGNCSNAELQTEFEIVKAAQ